MEEKVIQQTKLDNGLSLSIIDHSRKIAADRFYLCMTARIEIAVADHIADLDSMEDVSSQEVADLLGDTVLFEQKMERNFVDERDKDEIFTSMLASMQENTLQYYGHSDFAKRFIVKEYAAVKQKRNRFQR